MQEYMKEKDEVAELVARIAREDAEEENAKRKKQQESKEMLQRFKIEQAERQEAMEQAELEENQRIAQFAADKADREERLAQEKLEAEKEKDRILLGMIGEQEAKNKRAEELEQLRNDLHQEEHEAEARRREEMQLRKKLEDREEMKRAYVTQMDAQERKKALALEEEDKIRTALLAKFAEDDRIEQMNEHKRRMKIEAHKREAQRLIDLRREQFEQAREAERNQEQLLREEEKQRQAIIEQERQKLLKEYGVPLRDFLPKGTLEHQGDFDMIFGERRVAPGSDLSARGIAVA
jgi:hypothetical protein